MDETLKKILMIKDQKGINDAQFCKDLGFYPSMVSEWKNGSSKSYKKHLWKIAEYFDVPSKALTSNIEEPPISPSVTSKHDDGFCDIFEHLCDKKNAEPNAVTKGIGLSTAYNAQSLSDRIKQQAKDRNIKLKDMLIALDLNINAISQISDKKGLSCFPLAQIADYLDCSVDYLLGRTDKPDITYKTSSGTRIVIEAMTPPNVEALQRVYACLDETGQDKVIAYAEDLIQSGKYKKNTAVHLIAARGDGGIKELSEEEYKKLEKAIQDLPDANDLDYL